MDILAMPSLSDNNVIGAQQLAAGDGRVAQLGNPGRPGADVKGIGLRHCVNGFPASRQ
jgi:hypothetical protein